MCETCPNLTMGRFLHYFLVLLLLTLNILSLWMSLNATFRHIFAEHQIGVIFMEVFAKHYFATVPMTSHISCVFISCYDDIIFIYLFFFCSSYMESLLNIINADFIKHKILKRMKRQKKNTIRNKC